MPFPVISPVPSMASGPRLSTAGRTSCSTRWHLLCLLAVGLWSGGCRYLAKTDLNPAPLAPQIPLASTDPSQAQRLSMARMAMQSGDANGAMEIYDSLLSQNPTLAAAHAGRGDVYMSRTKYQDAETAYRRAALLDPDDFGAQYGLSCALQKMGDWKEAVIACHRALTLEPGNAAANLNLAGIYMQTGQPDRAVTFATEAVTLSPRDGTARKRLGRIHEALDELWAAADSYAVAAELLGNDPDLLAWQLRVLATLERFEEAVEVARELVRIGPSAMSYERLGWCYFQLRNYPASLDAYQSAIAQDPRHWPSLNGVGATSLNQWLLSGRQDPETRSAAGDAFRSSLRWNPDQATVRKILLDYEL